ncbi:hypothetical protein TM7_0550 [candidate division TM7 genomosp. GTL1]|nr:hypothetical protein TM7_0550 [candidate division TM7 genomosp. GTL1]
MKYAKPSGFTTIELLVTLFVATAFIAAFAQIFSVIDRGTTEAKWQSAASNLAYSNLRKYSSASDVTGFACNSTTNLTTNASAAGQVIQTNNYTGSAVQLPGSTVTVEVRAFAPAGCGTTPIKLVATTTFGGAPIRKVIHATYVY